MAFGFSWAVLIGDMRIVCCPRRCASLALDSEDVMSPRVSEERKSVILKDSEVVEYSA